MIKKLIFILVFFSILTLVISLQFGTYIHTKLAFTKSKTPAVYSLPTAMNSSGDVNAAKFQPIKNCEISFSNAFGELKTVNQIKGNDCNRDYFFETNKRVTFIKFEIVKLVIDSKIKTTKPALREHLLSKSQYEIIREIFAATPENMTLLGNREETDKIFTYLVLKEQLLEAHKYYADGFFMIENENFNGWLFGMPGTSVRIDLILFNVDGSYKYDVLLEGMSESEVMNFISSLKRIS